MPNSLVDLNLHQFPDTYLAGTWRVESRELHRAAANAPLAQATHLHLHKEGLRLDTLTAPLAGEWRITRDPLLSRPYLEFIVDGETVRALITRLRRSTDGLYQALVLYFQSGLELVLTQP
jgi:hypothetical protein